MTDSDLNDQQRIHADYSLLLANDDVPPLFPNHEWRRRLKAIRIAKGLSAEELAQASKTTTEAIRAVETEWTVPSLRSLLRWIRALSGSLDAFLKDPAKVDADLSNPQVCKIWICNDLECPMFRTVKASNEWRVCEGYRPQREEAWWE